jgi:long-chain acyl-CoA synthetase
MARRAKAGTAGRAKKAKPSPRPAAWLAHYPAAVKWDMPLAPMSLPAMFDEAVKTFADKEACDFLGARITYRELARLVERVTAGLQALGIGRGHRVGLFLPNTPYYVAAYFALLKTGATVVNFNPLYTVEELAVQARDAGIFAMVTLDLKVLFDKVEALAASSLLEHIVVCPFADSLPPVKRIAFRLFKRGDVARHALSSVAARIIDWTSLAAHAGKPTPVIIKPEEDVALLQYTGGTTGVPKGAMLTHANLTINVQQVIAWKPDVVMGGERIMGILPLFHVFAMTVVMNFAVRCGALMILLPRFDLAQAVKVIKRTRPTILPGVPTLFTALLNFPGITREDLSSINFCLSGGAPLPREVRTRFEEFSGSRMVEGYGLSETSPVATCNPLDGLRKDDSIGQPLPGTVLSVRSLDDPRKEMPPGEPGEICIKGPQVMAGYWNQPEATRETFVGDFFRSGDVGYMDADGFFYVIDRIKDMINCSGFKVYPRQVEEAIYAHPAVAEVTVVGIPDDYRGEAPKAFVKLKSGMSATAEEILQFLEPKLSKIEMPSAIEFRKELPKSLIGKLSKKELRAAARR